MSKATFELTSEQEKVLDCNDNQLILGGPGSGKTTIAILKAAQISNKHIKNYQKVLFLSFARATISRVIEEIDNQELIDTDTKKKIEADTYHSFFWKIIKTHGYLLGLPRKLSILLPQNEAIALSNIRNEYGREASLTDKEKEEKNRKEFNEIKRIAFEEGKIVFNLFAKFTFALLKSSNKIRNIISTSYPVIILDEFQDTNSEQWDVVKCLGKNSKLIVLADPEQRIFDFIGADPNRLNHYKVKFTPKIFDFTDSNHRSSDTDILEFGNDLLVGKFKDKYSGISIYTFEPIQNIAFARLKSVTLTARKRLINQDLKNWTIAILVPTKKLMYQISDSFNNKGEKLPAIRHTASIDFHGAILAAEIIAFLLQPATVSNNESRFIKMVSGFFYGKGGDSPTKKDINEATNIEKQYAKLLDCRLDNKKLSKSSIIHYIIDTYVKLRKQSFSGNPIEDWITIRNIFEISESKRMQSIAYEAKNLRLLRRGTQLRDSLSQNWRENGAYSKALEIIRHFFLIEHFATSRKPENGVVIMNMHKAKGKQFDEVIIFEGWPRRKLGEIVSNPDRIVRQNLNNDNLTGSKYNFRVSITRAKQHTTILTPNDDPCILLL